VQPGIDACKSGIPQEILESHKDATDILTLVQEAQSLGESYHSNNIKGVTLKPMSHVGIRARTRYLLEALAE
jgi:hypothetical protein